MDLTFIATYFKLMLKIFLAVMWGYESQAPAEPSENKGSEMVIVVTQMELSGELNNTFIHLENADNSETIFHPVYIHSDDLGSQRITKNLESQMKTSEGENSVHKDVKYYLRLKKV